MFGRFGCWEADNLEGTMNAEEAQAVLFKNDRRVILFVTFIFTSLILNGAGRFYCWFNLSIVCLVLSALQFSGRLP